MASFIVTAMKTSNLTKKEFARIKLYDSLPQNMKCASPHSEYFQTAPNRFLLTHIFYCVDEFMI
jgi:hypothetical protein